MKLLFGLLVWAGLCLGVARGVEPQDYAFQVSAQAAYAPARLILSWAPVSASSVQVRRKLLSDANWGGVIGTLPGNATSFTDSAVEIGTIYEYQLAGVVATSPSPQWAYGYAAGGIEVPAEEKRGTVVLIVDRTHGDALAAELALLRSDLIGDGWSVARRDVWPTDSVGSVKGLIKAEYTADPANVRAVFLFGHVPVPYSGLINPDMHPNHLGAWPADAYYGDMDGNWTDTTVNSRAAEYDENDNVPGDGKFDQSVIPSAVELEVGRVDLWGLPSFGARTERELLRNYLNKDHRFRQGLMTAAGRGLIRDNFRVIDEDAPALDGWRAFAALFGRANIREVGAGAFFPTLATDGYLWAYAGGGGDIDHADGVGSTADFAANDPKAVFLLLHGSYFGDWNNEDNFLRAALATPTYSLVSIWSSLPHWYFHPLAVGKSIGFATKMAQNNRGVYKSHQDYSFGEAHISMQGDPTLRSFVVAPPNNVRMSVGAKLTLNWDAVGGAVGYHVYRGASAEGPFTRLNRSLLPTNGFEHVAPANGDYVYVVKAAALQVTGGGSFQNLSQGVFFPYTQSGTVVLPVVNVAAIDSQGDEAGNYLVYQFTRDGSLSAGLDVQLGFAGTATRGADYESGTTVSFAPGSAEVKLTIYPTADGATEGAESLAVTILANGNYTVGTASSATGMIALNGESRIAQWVRPATGPIEFTATGFPNSSYRVESRTPEGAWRSRATGIAGADGAVTFREGTAVNACEIYRVVWE